MTNCCARAIERHGGHVFKTVGDAFCAAFWRAPDAAAAAIDAQRELSGEDWNAIGGLQVRMALHSGTTDEREGDYFGPAVNRVARLLATAHGGQVVFSGATASLLRGLMPECSELCDLGEHRLADLAEPEHVWQLVAPGLAQTFPPLRSLESMPNNLPRQLTPLIGRDEVLAEIEPADTRACVSDAGRHWRRRQDARRAASRRGFARRFERRRVVRGAGARRTMGVWLRVRLHRRWVCESSRSALCSRRCCVISSTSICC